jgi:hypothetical protein
MRCDAILFQPSLRDWSLEIRFSLTSADRLDEMSIKNVMEEAVAKAAIPFAPRGAPRLIIKSISAKQRPRRPA